MDFDSTESAAQAPKGSEAKDSILAALRASHDEVQDLAMRAMRGDFERRTDQ